MATNLKNLSSYNKNEIASGTTYRIGIVVSEWNEAITGALLEGALASLLEHEVLAENIFTEYVPGSFELPSGAQLLLEYKQVDAVICLGCVIQGETKHFDFVCAGAAQGIMQTSLAYKRPVIFGVLTTNTIEQAYDRAGGKHGNKGTEAAITALKMIQLGKSLNQ